MIALERWEARLKEVGKDLASARLSNEKCKEQDVRALVSYVAWLEQKRDMMKRRKGL